MTPKQKFLTTTSEKFIKQNFSYSKFYVKQWIKKKVGNYFHIIFQFFLLEPLTKKTGKTNKPYLDIQFFFSFFLPLVWLPSLLIHTNSGQLRLVSFTFFYKIPEDTNLDGKCTFCILHFWPIPDFKSFNYLNLESIIAK